MSKLVEIKTKETSSSVEDYLNGLSDEQQRKDSFEIVRIMQKVSKEAPKMWGSSIIGFGNVRYKSPKTGREVEWFKIGFSPRKANISLHLVFDLKSHADELLKLGKHKSGVGCIYVKKLADVDLKVLEKLVLVSLKDKK
jgi:hypothetical protein